MKLKSPIRLSVSGTCLLLCASAHSADLYWDANGSTAGTGGTGTWNTTSTTTWRNGSDTGGLQAFAANDVAYLGGTAGTEAAPSVITLASAVTANGVRMLSSATGESYRVTGPSTTNRITPGTNAILEAPAGKILAFTGVTSGQVFGGTATAICQGGGTLTVTGTNRVFQGTFRATGNGTTLRINGTNALNSDSSNWPYSTALEVRDGGSIEITGTNNYKRNLNLGATGAAGGTLKLAHNGALVVQRQGDGSTSFGITVLGTGKSTILSTLSNTGTAIANYGAINGNGGVYGILTVNATGDPSGVDLEYSAGFRNGQMTKNGTGVMRLNSGFPMSRSNDYTSFGNTAVTLQLNNGVFINEGTIKNITSVSGGTLKTGAGTGTFDVVNLNANGTFEISHNTNLFTTGLTYASGQNAINFNGGTLRFATGFADDVSALFGSIGANGGSIDTDGQNVTFASPLGGSGTLAKKGSGNLTLSGAHTLAEIAVDAGSLKIAPGASLAGTTVNLRGTGQLDATGGMVFPNGVLRNDIARDTGVSDVSGDLTLGTSAILRPGGKDADFSMRFQGGLALNGTCEIDITALGLDLIEVDGNLDVTGGSFSVNLATATPVGGIVATYGGVLTGIPQLSGYVANSRYAPALVHNAGAKTIELTISGSAAPLALEWNGGEGSAWDLTTTQKNFTQTSTSTPDTFRQLDPVTFGNPTGSATVVLTGELAPGGLTFNHTVDYTLGGTGSIAGTTSLVKDGTGILNLNTDNSYSGGTTITAGQINVGNGGATGSLGSGAITNNGTLAFNRSSNLTLGAVVSGSGSVSFNGGGVFTLAETNTYTGGTTVLGGTLKQGKAGAIPTPAAGTSTVTIGNGASLDLGGFALAGSAALPVVVSGPGTGPASGAVTNSGSGLFSNGISFLSLAGDTSIGNDGPRFDLIGTAGAGGIIPTTPLTPRKLTKIGTNQISLKTDDYSGISELVVQSGTIGVENDNLGAPTRPITIGSAGALSLWGGRTITSPITMNGGVLRSDNATTNVITGDVVLAVGSTFSAASATGFAINGIISGGGGLTKSDAGDLTLGNANTYTGNTTLSGTGRLILNHGDALGTTGSVDLAGGAGSQLTLALGGMTLTRPATVRGGGRVGEGLIFASAAGSNATMAGDVTVSGAHGAGGTFGSVGTGELIVSGKVTQTLDGLDPLQPTLATPVRISARLGTVRFSNPANDFRWLYLSEGTVKLGVENGLPTGCVVSLGDNANASSLDLNGCSQTLRSLARWGSTGTTTIRNTGAGPATLTFNTDFTGIHQTETALAAGTAAADGDVAVTVTGVDISGSPIVVSVPVTTGDTPEVWAGKVRVQLAATGAIGARYDVSGSAQQITLRRKTVSANDPTLNIALANGASSPGITAAPTSVNAVPGVTPAFAGDTVGGISLVKTGPETLTLAGTFAHTGTTSLNQGKLVFNATHTGGGDYTTAPGTVLVGNGTTGAPVTANGTISGGDTDTLGSLNTGSLNLNSGSTLVVNINSTDISSDYIKANGDVTLSGTVNLTITDVNPVPLGLGISLLVLGHTGAWSGTLTHAGNPVPDEGVIAVGPNYFKVKYHDTTPATPAMTLTAVANPAANYASWADLNGVSGGPNGDSDSDGIPNLVEYALADGTRGTLAGNTLTFAKRGTPYGNDISYAIEVSTDLGDSDSWEPAPSGITETPESISYAFTPGSPVRNFARLRISQN